MCTCVHSAGGGRQGTGESERGRTRRTAEGRAPAAASPPTANPAPSTHISAVAHGRPHGRPPPLQRTASSSSGDRGEPPSAYTPPRRPGRRATASAAASVPAPAPCDRRGRRRRRPIIFTKIILIWIMNIIINT